MCCIVYRSTGVSRLVRSSVAIVSASSGKLGQQPPVQTSAMAAWWWRGRCMSAATPAVARSTGTSSIYCTTRLRNMDVHRRASLDCRGSGWGRVTWTPDNRTSTLMVQFLILILLLFGLLLMSALWQSLQASSCYLCRLLKNLLL